MAPELRLDHMAHDPWSWVPLQWPDERQKFTRVAPVVLLDGGCGLNSGLPTYLLIFAFRGFRLDRSNLMNETFALVVVFDWILAMPEQYREPIHRKR